MNIYALDYIGILGFNNKTSDKHRTEMESLTENIVLNGFGVCAGSISGPLFFAFRKAKQLSGTTRLIINSELTYIERNLCDILEMVSDPLTKHELMANVCLGGIIVSGGLETAHLVDCFIRSGKPVVGLKKYIKMGDFSNQISYQPDIKIALERLLQLHQNNHISINKRG